MPFRDLKHQTDHYKKEALSIEEYPSPETYNFVLRRLDLLPRRGNYFIFNSYNEQCRSKPAIIDGRIAHTIFLRLEHSMLYAVKMGWENVTEQWKSQLIKEIPRPTSTAQQQIYKFLEQNPGYHHKAKILESIKVPDTRWRTAIGTLKSKDLVDVQGFGKAAKYKMKPMKN